MYKRALMLTAATLALMSSPVLAAGPTTISDNQTTQQKTSTTEDLTIAKGGSVVIKASSPAVVVDSSNTVTTADGSKISNLDTDNAIGIQLNADGWASTLSAGGLLDLTGSGVTKTGILVAPTAATGTLTGDLTLLSTSVVKVSGNNAFGLRIGTGATLSGNINLAGTISAANDTTGSKVSSNATGVEIDGAVSGNIINTGNVGAIGTAARGMVILAPLGGSLQNAGTIGVTGINQAAASGNPIAGSALVIGDAINGGIFNSGPITDGGATAKGAIASSGSDPTINISATASGTGKTITIGAYTDNGVTASFLNRGTVQSSPIQSNMNSVAIQMVGADANHIDLKSGIYNSGTIGATSANDATGTGATAALALSLTQYTDVAGSLQNIGGSGGAGTISANLSGSLGGSALAVFVGKTSSLSSITNSGTISAAASSTDSTVETLAATAISDQSSKLLSINNSGTISALTTVLDNGKQSAIAADLSNAAGNITFTNTGKIAGSILLGTGNDTLTVNGTTSAAANVLGDIAFGGGSDTLTIGTNSIVSGGITETAGGTVDVTVTSTGALTLTNKTQGLKVGNLSVGSGSTLGLTLSEPFNQATTPAADALISGNSITLDPNANFKLNYGGFVSAISGQNAKFTLLEANTLSINLPKLQNDIAGDVPFLFQNCATGACLTQTTSGALNQLVLSLTPKTTSELGLTGNAAVMFPLANEALAKDNDLGAALVASVKTNADAQAAYLAFAPDVTGANRATVISLTDQATGPVAARQRALRMYAAQPGELTLWGQEFAQRLNQGKNTAEGAFRGTGFGFVLGADAGTPQAGRYGAAFSFFSGNSNEKQPRTSKSTMEWYMLTAYTDWRGKGFFLDSQASVAYGNLKSRRFIRLVQPDASVFSRTASSTQTGLAGALGVTTGAVFTFGSTSFVPQISIDGMTMRQDGYTETGGGAGVNLKVQPVYAHSARGFIGTAIRQDIDMGGFYIQPEGRIGYRYDFLNGGAKIKGQFVSTGSTFQINGPDPDKGNIVAGGSLAVTTGAWSIGLNYDYIRGTHGDVNQVGTISLLGRI